LKKKILITFKALVTFILLALLFNNIDFNETIKHFRSFDLLFLVFALCALILQAIIITMRWKKIILHLDVHYTFVTLLRYIWIGSFFNQALPSSVGGDALRGYCLYRDGLSIKNSTLSVLIDRIFGIIGLVLFAMLAFSLLSSQIDSVDLKIGVLITIFGLVVAILSIFSLDLFIKKTNYKVVRGLLSLSHESRKIALNSFSGVRLTMLSVIVHFLSVVTVIILAEGMNMNIQWIGIFTIIPMVSLLMVVPVSIGGWGVRESGMVVGLGYFGVEPEYALALSILYGATVLIVTLPGLLLWSFNKSNYDAQ
jgi:uncharacterized protein (TIRG00374 family)